MAGNSSFLFHNSNEGLIKNSCNSLLQELLYSLLVLILQCTELTGIEIFNGFL